MRFGRLCLVFLSFSSGLFAEAIKGSVTFVEGRAFIVRGVKTLPAKVAFQVEAGDVVTVEQGSKLTLDLTGTGLLKITEKTKFEIPATEAESPKTSKISLFFGGIWTEAKKVLQGESFEIKTPTATAGVRGTKFGTSYDEASKTMGTVVEEGHVVAQTPDGNTVDVYQGMAAKASDGGLEAKIDKVAVAQNAVKAAAVPDNNSPEAKAKADAEVKAKEKELQEAQVKAGEEAKAKAEVDKKKADAEKAKADAEKAKAEAAKLQGEAKAKAEAEAKTKAEAAAKLEAEAKAKSDEQAAKAKAAVEEAKKESETYKALSEEQRAAAEAKALQTAKEEAKKEEVKKEEAKKPEVKEEAKKEEVKQEEVKVEDDSAAKAAEQAAAAAARAIEEQERLRIQQETRQAQLNAEKAAADLLAKRIADELAAAAEAKRLADLAAAEAKRIADINALVQKVTARKTQLDTLQNEINALIASTGDPLQRQNQIAAKKVQADAIQKDAAANLQNELNQLRTLNATETQIQSTSQASQATLNSLLNTINSLTLSTNVQIEFRDLLTSKSKIDEDGKVRIPVLVKGKALEVSIDQNDVKDPGKVQQAIEDQARLYLQGLQDASRLEELRRLQVQDDRYRREGLLNPATATREGQGIFLPIQQ